MPSVIRDTLDFYKCFWYFTFAGGTYASCPHFKGRKYAKVHVYSLSVIFYLWSFPHYRNATFHQDMVKNLRNVAIPGTGVPLSLLCITKPIALLGIMLLYPLVCIVAAAHRSQVDGIALEVAYREQLLEPCDWFSFWRLNCRLASFHSLLCGGKGYEQENKWTFLNDGVAAGVPVSPFLDMPSLVIKDKNEEGGMGIFFYKNALHGGDWIIQERLYNDDFIRSLLPETAPLSTMRIITASRYTLEESKGEGKPGEGCIKALSCVFRAGMAGAATDHSSILFDVDATTGTIKAGTTNSHWYKLGLDKVRSTPWLSSHDITHHPDNNFKIAGATIPDMTSKLKLVMESHYKLLPEVPLVGWDVAMTTKGPVLLEVNLSCNFFRGSFDLDGYVSFMDDFFTFLDAKRHAAAKPKSS